MQSAALVVREVVTFVVRDEVDHGPLGQGGRLVENEPPFSTRARRGYCTGFEHARQASGRPYLIDLLETAVRVQRPGIRDAIPTENPLRHRAAGIDIPTREDSPTFRDWTEVFLTYKQKRLEPRSLKHLRDILPVALRFWVAPDEPVTATPEKPFYNLRLRTQSTILIGF